MAYGKRSECCNAPFVYFPSLNIKKCAGCSVDYVWKLDEGQAPLITSSKDKGDWSDGRSAKKEPEGRETSPEA